MAYERLHGSALLQCCCLDCRTFACEKSCKLVEISWTNWRAISFKTAHHWRMQGPYPDGQEKDLERLGARNGNSGAQARRGSHPPSPESVAPKSRGNTQTRSELSSAEGTLQLQSRPRHPPRTKYCGLQIVVESTIRTSTSGRDWGRGQQFAL